MKKASCTFLKYTFAEISKDGEMLPSDTMGFDSLKEAIDSFLKSKGYDPEKNGDIFYSDCNGETPMTIGFDSNGTEVKAAFFCTQFRVVDITAKEVEKAIEE